MKQAVQNPAESSKAAGNNLRGSAIVSPTPLSEVPPTAKGTAEIKETPPAFAGLDFKNFSYPTNLRGKVTLKAGTRVLENPEGGGGDTFEFRDIKYSDVTGDGKDEAIRSTAPGLLRWLM